MIAHFNVSLDLLCQTVCRTWVCVCKRFGQKLHSGDLERARGGKRTNIFTTGAVSLFSIEPWTIQNEEIFYFMLFSVPLFCNGPSCSAAPLNF